LNFRTGFSDRGYKGSRITFSGFITRPFCISGQNDKGPWRCHRSDTKLRSKAVRECAFVCFYFAPQSFLFALQQLKALEIAIESFRASIPKAKFVFKRRPQAQPQNQTVVPLTTASQSPGNAKPTIPATSCSLVISSQSNNYITRSSVGEWTDLVISELDNCIVDLLAPSRGVSNELKASALHVRNLTRCVLLLPPVAGSALLHDLTDCTVVLGCHQVCEDRVYIFTFYVPGLQFRMHSSKNVDVFLSISSDPIIEHCERIRFARYPSLLYPAVIEQVRSSVKCPLINVCLSLS